MSIHLRAGVLFLLLAACGPAPVAPPPAACDLLLISLDTCRADALTFDDPERAPHLTALAERGVVFEQAIAGSSWTLPSHVELVTGLPPILHGVHDDHLAIDPRHRTLGEHLDERGARTVGVWSGWYLAPAYGFDRGFDRYLSALPSDPDADRDLAAALSRGGSAAQWAGDLRGAASHRAVTSERVVDLALEALDEAQEGEPLALFLHLFDPHHDFVPPPPFDTRFDPDYAGDLDGRDYWSNPCIVDPRSGQRVVGERDLEHLRALYAGEIAWCDHQLGRLIDALAIAGRLERTLIVVTSDHGEEFFEHGNRGHRQTLYDESLLVPLLVVPPLPAEGPDRARRGSRVAEQVRLADIAPTVLDYAGGAGEASSTLWGQSLRPEIEGAALDSRPAVVCLAMPGATSRWLEAVRTPEGKLVRRILLDEDGAPIEVEDVEWFDLRADPGETRNPSAEDLSRVRAAWVAAEALGQDLRRFANDLPRSPLSRRTTGVRAVFASELQALGYAGGGGGGHPPLTWPGEPLEALSLPETALRR